MTIKEQFERTLEKMEYKGPGKLSYFVTSVCPYPTALPIPTIFQVTLRLDWDNHRYNYSKEYIQKNLWGHDLANAIRDQLRRLLNDVALEFTKFGD